MSTLTRVGIKVRDGNFEKAYSIFKNKVRKSGILERYKENQYYTKPSDKKRLEKRKRTYNIQKKKKKVK